MNAKRVLISMVAALVLLVGAGAAYATSQSETTTGAENGDDSVKGSVSVQELAKVDEAAAKEAALKAVPGTVEETSVSTENGYVVYNVEVAGDDGKAHDLTVDAGNGEILHQEAEDSESEDSD